jgi:outer membrane protein
MKLIRILLLMTLPALCGMLNAQQEPVVLSMEQAREYALQHNKSLLNARDNVASSKEKVRETLAQGLPQVDGSVDFMTYFNYEMNFSFGSSGGETEIDFTKLDAGDLEILNVLGQMFGPSEPIIMDNQLSAQAQFSQLIFSGQFIAGVQTARIARKLADQSLAKSEFDVKENITNSYYVILVTEQTYRIIGENLNNLATMQQHTENLYKAGMAEETDVDQLRITVSQLKNTQKSIERTIQLNYNMLKYQLGLSPDADLVLSDNLEKLMDTANPQSLLSNDFSITDNIGYQVMESQVLLSKKQVDLQHWAYAPSAAAFYSYTKKILTTGFDLTPNHLAGFNVSVPIFSSGMRRSRVAQAKIDLDIALRNQDMVKDQLETQKRQLLFNYQNAWENFTTQKENVGVARRVLTSIQNKYREGMVSSLDLTQANTNLLNAENNYLSSVITLLQAQTSLEKLYQTI